MEGDEGRLDSILETTKNLLNATYDVFDRELITYINAALSSLHQLGVGPSFGLYITGPDEKWDSLTASKILSNLCKTYVYLKVRLSWDPPTSGIVLSSLENQLKETEWRILAEVETRSSGSSNGPTGNETNYELLNNLPSLNGKTILGNMEELDPTVGQLLSTDVLDLFEKVFEKED